MEKLLPWSVHDETPHGELEDNGQRYPDETYFCRLPR